jgi:hypothetical protein
MSPGKYIVRYVTIICCIFSVAFCVSCSTVFFDHPQPTDSDNMTAVPGELRGTWHSDCKNTKETIIIDRTSYHKTTILSHQIAKARADTSGRYRIADGKIYMTDELNKGYPYKLQNDTIFYTERLEEGYVLSDTVLLRSAKNCYVLNLKKMNLWEIALIQKMENGEIRIGYPIAYDLLEFKSKYNVVVLDSTRKDTVVFHADFKRRNIGNIINNDGEGTIYILKPDSTFYVPN